MKHFFIVCGVTLLGLFALPPFLWLAAYPMLVFIAWANYWLR